MPWIFSDSILRCTPHYVAMKGPDESAPAPLNPVI